MNISKINLAHITRRNQTSDGFYYFDPYKYRNNQSFSGIKYTEAEKEALEKALKPAVLLDIFA